MSRNAGFSFIEIIIAMAIASVLALILYRAFSQASMVVQQVRTLITDNRDMLTLHSQIEKDFSGVFIPVKLDMLTTSTTNPSTGSGLDGKGGAAQSQSGPNKASQDKKQTEKKNSDVAKIFFSTMREGKLDRITFLTTNALTVFDEIAVRAVLVTYRLKMQEDSSEKLFTLLREESSYDPTKKESEKPSNAYALMRNITECTIEFYAYECSEKAKELMHFTEWGTETQEKKCPKVRIPEFVIIKISIWDMARKESIPHMLELHIPSAHCQKNPEEKKQQQVTSTPAAAPAQNQPPGQQNIVRQPIRIGNITLGGRNAA